MTTEQPEIGVGNVAMVGADIAAAPAPDAPERRVRLVADAAFLDAVGPLPAPFVATPLDQVEAGLVDDLAGGDWLLWVGPPDAIPSDLWVGGFRVADGAMALRPVAGAALSLDGVAPAAAGPWSAFLRPPKEMPFHNVDEELRADLVPLVEAVDRFDQVTGWPAVLVRHHGPSLVHKRFAGAEWLFFLFDSPVEALDVAVWRDVLQRVADRLAGGVQLRRVETGYASYRVGERAQVRARVANLRGAAAAVDLHFSVLRPGDEEFRHVQRHRRCPDGGNESEAVCDFLLQGPPGLWRLRVEAYQDPDVAEELSLEGTPAPVDRHDIAVVVLARGVESVPLVEIDGTSLRIDGEAGFWVGTHYYPSSSWWDWLWRDFRPLTADRDFAAIRAAGYRIVRLWIDPVLDEVSLRAMDAAVWLAAQHGLVADICVFTQWVSRVGFERTDGEHVEWAYREPTDGNVYSVSFRHLDLQREYIGVLARRWQRAGNVMWNLANEAYVKDPDGSQMDDEVRSGEVAASPHGTARDSELFRQWADAMTAAVREAGAAQPVVPGYLFTLAEGGDSFVANRHGDIAPWHCYLPDLAAASLAYVDPASTGRPLLLQEFGVLGWNNADAYDWVAHQALGAGAAAAMSYEWGVSWLARDVSYHPVPLRTGAYHEPDPRWFPPYSQLGDLWPAQAAGICPTPSGFGYGSIYHGTPFPAAAAVALGRLGAVGRGLARAVRPERAYVVAPTARNEDIERFHEALRTLWEAKAVFGVWQEGSLDALPDSAHVVVCPMGVSTAAGTQALARLRHEGVTVVEGQLTEEALGAIPRCEVANGDGLELLVRRTTTGTLYALVGASTHPRVELRTEQGHVVVLDVDRYALVHDTPAGIELVESAGQVVIDGSPLLSVERGRVFVEARDGRSLATSRRLRVVVTEPTVVQLGGAPSAATAVTHGGQPVGAVSMAAGALVVDDALVRYAVDIERAPST